MSEISIPIEITSDKKGYYDRQCPSEKCEYIFKIYLEDWKENVTDEQVFCPMCGYTAASDQWFTHEQIESMREIAASYAKSYLSDEFNKMFGKLSRDMNSNKHLKITYTPGKKISFVNNPIGQRPEWELDIKCEKCQTKYSVIGSAYFCPCCGHNAVERVFNESLDTVEKMIESIKDIYGTFEKIYGNDKAESMSRSMIEGSLGDIVSAFQKYTEEIYKNIMPNKKVRVNDFQIIEKGSNLFKEATGNGYDTWLSQNEIEEINLFFQQRHIIEHNNGLIDERYLQNSGDISYKIGQRVIIRKQDVKRLLAHVRKLSDGLSNLIIKS